MLNDFTLERLTTLYDTLEEIEHDPEAELASLLRCIEETTMTKHAIEEQLRSHEFGNPEEEIHFFKKLKPQVDGRLIFYTRLLRILQQAPVGGLKEKSQYFHDQMPAVQLYYRHNAELHLYYRLGLTYLDPYYFMRATGEHVPDTEALDGMVDRRINARKSVQYACFLGFELLLRHLDDLANGVPPANAPGDDEMLIWTGSQAGLVELIYGLNEMGVFNYKKLDIKKVADYFSRVFNIKFANIYKTHEDNRLRKKARTPFLDELRKSLVNKFDYDDEHAL